MARDICCCFENQVVKKWKTPPHKTMAITDRQNSIFRTLMTIKLLEWNVFSQVSHSSASARAVGPKRDGCPDADWSMVMELNTGLYGPTISESHRFFDCPVYQVEWKRQDSLVGWTIGFPLSSNTYELRCITHVLDLYDFPLVSHWLFGL